MTVLYILLAILFGLLIPWGHHLTFLVRYFLMSMLLFTYLPVDMRQLRPERRHLWVLAANLALPAAAYLLLAPFDPVIAQAVLATALTPTAANAPVIAAMLGLEAGFATTSTLLTHLGVAFVLPPALPLLLGSAADISVGSVLGPVLVTIFLPLAAAVTLRGIRAPGPAWSKRLRTASIVLFIANVYIATAQASQFLREDRTTSRWSLLALVLVIGLLCFVQFRLGERLGPPERRLETGIALGRKNTVFGLWVALTFLGPGAALGPVVYTIWQNLYHSWLMYTRIHQD